MSIERKKHKRVERRTLRSRSRLKRVSSLPRVSVFRSSKHIYAQLIDDAAGITVASASSLELKSLSGDKKTVAKEVGLELAKRIQARGIDAACFDRGQFLYHGRVQELAEGLREGGLKI